MVFQIPEDRDSKCYNKAKQRNQPTFTLVAQDMLAIETIVFWRDRLKESNPNSPKIAEADEDIARFTEFADTHPDVMKIPD